MPSCQLFTQSGGIGIVNTDLYGSGQVQKIIGGIQLKLAKGAPSLIYVGLPNLSGAAVTGGSGGVFSSGGIADGMEMNPGDAYFIPNLRLTSGILTPQIGVPAAASGGRLFWEIM